MIRSRPLPAASRRAPARWRTVLLLAALSLTLALAGARVWRLLSLAQTLRAEAQALESAAQPLDLAALRRIGPSLARARLTAAALRAEAAPLLPLAPHLAWLPYAGPDIAAAPALLELAAELTLAADSAAAALLPVADVLDAPPLLPALTERLAAARPQLLAAQEALRRAEAARSRLAAAARSPGMQAPLRRVDALLPLARDGLELALAAPDLLGADGTRTYLVLLQDSNELRATGGFIGAVAEVTLDRGRLAVTFDDSEGIDDLAGHPYPEPPAPLQHYMGVDLWLFRDANWSPDFPTSARTALRFYQLGRGRVAGGVIAVDERAVQELLRATGPVVIPGEAQPVSAERVVQYMRGQYNRGFPQRRKAFLGPLAQAIAARLQAPGVDLPRLAAVARRALDERHALVYLPDGPLAPLLARYGWDGAVRPPADDFLMVVSSNVGYNKVGPYIAEQWSYTVDLTQPAAPYAQLSVRQTHTRAGPADCGWVERRRAARYEDYFAGCFWNYLRVLVPAGSTLFDAATNPTPGAWLRTGRDEPGAVTVAPGEANTFALSTFLIVPRGGTRETVLRYHLPPQVLRHDGRTWRYGITVQKQPGRDALPLTVRVRLPPGATLSATSLPPQSVAAPWVSYRLDLRQDQRLELAFSP